MPSEPTLLLIADIGGYTDYMGSHRMSLAHAEIISARLLETVVDAVPDFDLIEIEGDAAFLSHASGGEPPVALTLQAAQAMHRAFHQEREYVATNLCPCKTCTQTDDLKLKFVAHLGEVATQTIRQQRKLVGIDVIQVHRMLKNPVDVPEYVLMSEELHRTADAELPAPVREVPQHLEGIGPVRSYFVDLADLPGQAAPLDKPSLLGRVGRTLNIAGSGMPYMLGLRRGRRTDHAVGQPG
jgi:hypothetical protein